MAIGYDTRGRQRGEYQQQSDYRAQERVAWQALQEVAQRLLAESARPPRRFSTLVAYAQAHRAWRDARHALDLAAVPPVQSRRSRVVRPHAR